MAVCLNEETLHAWLDGELSADAAARAHLTGCAACAARAREAEQAFRLIHDAFDEELPAFVPSANLRDGVEAALIATTSVTISPWRSFLHSLTALRPRLAAAIAILVTLFIAGLVVRRWQSVTPEPGKFIGRREGPTVPPQIQPEPQADIRPKPKSRADRRIRRSAPLLAQPEPDAAVVSTKHAGRHARHSKRASGWSFEAGRHLELTQLLLRSFRNALVEEGDAPVDLAYEKQLSRELLGKNRLLRRSAERKEDSLAGALLGEIEPLLLDIANLPEKPSQEDVRSVKELIREQKIIATLQIYSAKAER